MASTLKSVLDPARTVVTECWIDGESVVVEARPWQRHRRQRPVRFRFCRVIARAAPYGEPMPPQRPGELPASLGGRERDAFCSALVVALAEDG